MEEENGGIKKRVEERLVRDFSDQTPVLHIVLWVLPPYVSNIWRGRERERERERERSGEETYYASNGGSK